MEIVSFRNLFEMGRPSHLVVKNPARPSELGRKDNSLSLGTVRETGVSGMPLGGRPAYALVAKPPNSFQTELF